MPSRVIDPPLGQLGLLRTPLTAGERKTLQLLDRELPAKWEIYVQPHLNGCRPDFVLLNPSIGIGVLEVKDWNLTHPEYHWESGRNDGRRLVRKHDGRTFQDPSRRLHQYKQEIFDLYCPRLERRAGIAAISAGLVFPFASEDRVHDLFRDSFSSTGEYAIGRDAFANGRIERLFPAARLTASRLMTEDLAEDLRSWLREPDHSQEQRLPLPLDPRQREYATTRTASGYRRIRGPAGSGKTTVLAARAANLSAEGKQVLVVTFNITLWHYLRDVCSRSRTGRVNAITWINFHALCRRLVAILGVEAASKEIWKDHFEHNADAFNDLPRLLGNVLEIEGNEGVERYDAILVDEGQDFQPEWWQLLRKLARPGAEMMLVADATQDLYGTARLWTDNAMIGAGFRGGWAELPLTYRLPEPLLTFAAEFARKFLPANGRQEPVSAQQELDTEPCSLRWLQVERHEVAETSVEELLNMVKSQRESAMTDLTVLVDRVEVGELIVAALRERNIKTIDTFAPAHESDKTRSREDRRKKLAFWKGASSVKVTTLHSFKGWEARLLVVCLTNAGSSMAMAAAYAGLTRLKRHPQGSALTVVCSDQRLRPFGKRWPTYIDATSGVSPQR
ncbi:MAG: UvrD-helicase domain-containing protein [Proteobacteria bacterium]|nr:UvrD-helicase domain-containing protein [Pseudomonadota bacterium]